MTLDAERRLAVALAEEAGRAVMAARGTAAVTHKPDGDPVTAADLAANRIIEAGIRARFPGDGILSEETADDSARLGRSRVWIVDPIDGTKEYIDGTDDFAVQIGLCVDGRPRLGVVHQVARSRLFVAVEGEGAVLEDPAAPDRAPRRLRVGAEDDPGRMRMTVSRWHRTKRLEALTRELKPASLLPAGSIGVKVGLVADGTADLYLHPSRKTAEWDTCAPSVVIHEAGGLLTDLFGEPLLYNRPSPIHPRGLIATNPRALPVVVKRIAEVAAGFGFT